MNLNRRAIKKQKEIKENVISLLKWMAFGLLVTAIFMTSFDIVEGKGLLEQGSVYPKVYLLVLLFIGGKCGRYGYKAYRINQRS